MGPPLSRRRGGPMFRSDDSGVRPAGPAELPPYYAQRLQVIEPQNLKFAGNEPPSVRSARYEAGSPCHSSGSPEAQAERLFRDFKLGLLTLVIVTLLLFAYFWDGGADGARTKNRAEEDVLSFSLTAQRRGEVLPYAHDRLPVRLPDRRAGPESRPGNRTDARSRPSAPAVAAGVTTTSRTRAYGYTVRSGDTLSAIALRFYGDASLWQEILRANRRRLRRPSELRVGMKIIVPVKVRRARRDTRNPAALARAGQRRRQ